MVRVKVRVGVRDTNPDSNPKTAFFKKKKKKKR